MELFETELEKKVQDLAKTYIGSDIGVFDDHLRALDLDLGEKFPFLVTTVRTSENQDQSEIGNDYDLWTWTVHIYYVDSQEDYATAKARRSKVMGTLKKNFEKNHNLNAFRVTGTDGHSEYIYDSKVEAVLFDYSGMEEYHTFVSEMYITFYTAKN